MELQVGGKRLGAGGKMTQEVREYERSTFNQSFDWKSSMAPGILYPFMCIPMTNGDTADIDLDAYVCTLPTKGPLFGSFKLQADIFSVPMRLYNGLLHNNPIDIGLKMNQIYMPKISLGFDETAPKVIGATKDDWQINSTSLLKYLGLSGIGVSKIGENRGQIYRKINAIPILGYYDIFKNYYANKQEEYAYVIEPGTPEDNNESGFTSAYIRIEDGTYGDIFNSSISLDEVVSGAFTHIKCTGNNLRLDTVGLKFTYQPEGEEPEVKTVTLKELVEADPKGTMYFDQNLQFVAQDGHRLEAVIAPRYIATHFFGWEETDLPDIYLKIKSNQLSPEYTADIILKKFTLKNIDRMREKILSYTDIAYEFTIGEDWDDADGNDGTGLPYTALTKNIGLTGNKFLNQNSFTQNGLVVKTYQADIFNNWIDTEWIEGENGIAAITAIDVSEGTLEMDALLLSQKVYNMLNRIAANGGTWDDYQEVVWTEKAVRKAETPIYEGGMSGEVMFEQVVSSSETEVQGDFQALGTLGGKGVLAKQNGGHDIRIEAKEPIFIMGIISLTPRICYTQGNEWYLTELSTFDDLHKPALDGIGYQDLIQEQMAWWNTQIENGLVVKRDSAGKIVAWSNYMTNYDKAFGDFAKPQGKGFMVLSRNYERVGESSSDANKIKDVTTYIDPAKYNYAFAYTDLAAQNFWVQLANKVIIRRKMSAHQIPNL